MDEPLHLMCWEHYDAEAKKHHQHRIRASTQDEFKLVKDATGFLLKLTTNSAYRELVETRDALERAVASMQTAWREQRGFPSDEAQIVERYFKYWLTNFRGFDDRTYAYLTERFGRGSDVLCEFKEALSHEYDRAFEYRLARELRNMSLHVDNVLTFDVASREDEDEGSVHELSVGLDCPRLAERFPNIKPAVRSELRQVTQEMDLGHLVSAVMASCAQAFAKLITSLETEIGTACSVLESIHREAQDAGGQAANIMDSPTPIGGCRRQFTVVWVDVHNAWIARQAVRDCKQLLGLPEGSGTQDAR